MKTVNKVILVGYVGADPEVRFMPDGNAVANFSIATTEKWKDKASGEKKERTDWHRLVVYGKLADIVKEYVHKGSPLYIEGALRTRKWQDKQTGADKYATEVIVSDLSMLGSKPASAQHESSRPAPAPASPPPPAGGEFDDDIPF